MDLDYFSYVTGLASLFGFIAQIMDWFPRHKELRKNIFLVLIGIFTGSLSSVFNTSSITFDFTVSGFSLLLISIGALIFILLVVAISSADSNKRGELYGVSGVAAFVFVMVLFFGSLVTIDNESTKMNNEKSKLTVGELILISDEAIKKKDFDRALMHLETIKHHIRTDDPRYKKIESKINEVKGMQF